MLEQVAPESLVLDFNLYPRHQVDEHNVRGIREARAAGIRLPPVIADRKTRKVADGFHRITQALRDKIALIDVEYRDYKDGDADLFEDALRLNQHGRQLTPYDKSRCIILAERIGMDFDRLSEALAMRPERLEDLRMRKQAIAPGATLERIPIKATSQHLANTKLSQRQVEGNRNAGGMHPLAYVNQVINLLEGNLVDKDNERLREGLKKLHGLLGVFLEKKPRSRKTG